MNGWRYVHEAGRLMAMLYHPQMVKVRLGGAVSELRQINSRESNDLADAIEKALASDAEGDLKAVVALTPAAARVQAGSSRQASSSPIDAWMPRNSIVPASGAGGPVTEFSAWPARCGAAWPGPCSTWSPT